MTEAVEKGLKKIGITVSKPILAIFCIIFGILVLAWKESLNYVVGIFSHNRRCSAADRVLGASETTTTASASVAMCSTKLSTLFLSNSSYDKGWLRCKIFCKLINKGTPAMSVAMLTSRSSIYDPTAPGINHSYANVS